MSIAKFFVFMMLTIVLGYIAGTVLYFGLYWLIYEYFNTTLYDVIYYLLEH